MHRGAAEEAYRAIISSYCCGSYGQIARNTVLGKLVALQYLDPKAEWNRR